ncbi:LmeA family phospholipid-binding protein [Actinoplanes sp. CA-030573]|uniref:LmeA family phospholipid-binding protein n=1 Tax=Actinoplanes sp. CA-030573 TaxID=3239898 RepID=UPI003D8E6B7B
MTALLPEVHRPAHHGVRGLRRKGVALAATGVTVLVALGMLALAVPVPGLEGFLGDRVRQRVGDQVACPGTLPSRPEVTVGGDGPLLPQALRGTLGELRVRVPDVTLSGVPHAAFAATMKDVSQPDGNSTHVGSMDAEITVAFANLPAQGQATRPSFHRAPDGGLTVDVVMPAEAADNVKARLYLTMSVQGETVRSVPQRLELFGRTVPAGQVSDLTGGVRTEKLPHLPDGVVYKSITPRADGLHVALGGVSTTPLSALPSTVGGRDVTYTAADGLLGINTSAIGLPLTIKTEPVLSGTTLTLTPRKVHILGGDHDPGDAIAKLVLAQTDKSSLSRTLPALPRGVSYRSVTVDPGGIRLVIDGVTVKPFSALSQPAGDHPTTFGAAGGLLTATQKGGSGEATPITLYGRPVIRGATLDIAPRQIQMFGIRFPAAKVLAEVSAQQTTFPLQKLPAGLAYGKVEVLPTGLRIRLSGRDVTLARGSLTGGSC